MNLKLIAKFLNDKLPETPKVTIVLGSGLSNFSEHLTNTISIPYSKIPGYLQTSVEGHKGEFVFGFINDLPVFCARGRFHYYEGHSIDVIQFPVRLFHLLGCKTLILTNAAGCIHKEWDLGDLMLINGYLDFTFRESIENPKVKSDFSNNCYTLLQIAEQVSSQKKVPVRKGVYCWTLGPSYETPAEIEEISKLGGDAVGMSTVPEIMQAQKLRMQFLGISCLTNYASGISSKPLSHTEVLETTDRTQNSFASLLLGILHKFSLLFT